MKARSLLAVALAAMLAPAVATAAQKTATRAQPAATSPMNALSIGGFVGYETDDLSGLSLRVDGEMPFRALAPQVNLSWVGSVGYSRLTDDESAFGIDFETTANILKFIPAARFSFVLTPQFTLFGDAGLGLYYASVEAETSIPGFGSTSVDDDEFSLMMRLGGGAFFDVNPKTRIGASLEFDPYFGDFDQTTFIIQAGAMFRL